MEKNNKNAKSTKVIANANCDSCNKLANRVMELENEIAEMRKPKPFTLKKGEGVALADAPRVYREAVALLLIKDGEEKTWESKKVFAEAKREAKSDPRALENLYNAYKLNGWSLENIEKEYLKVCKTCDKLRKQLDNNLEKKFALGTARAYEKGKKRASEKLEKEMKKNAEKRANAANRKAQLEKREKKIEKKVEMKKVANNATKKASK